LPIKGGSYSGDAQNGAGNIPKQRMGDEVYSGAGGGGGHVANAGKSTGGNPPIEKGT